MHVPTYGRAHARARAHTSAVSPHTLPRRIEHRPSACHVNAPPAGTAHTEDKVVTDAVFHAPMFVLNTDAA